jgi:uncharacterized protein (TIGR00375 family)
MTLDTMAAWAKVKGVKVLASADFTHPAWLRLIKEKLEPLGNGFFRLRAPEKPDDEHLKSVPFSRDDAAFVLSTELSFIYSKQGKVRKVHLLLLAPDFESVDKINARLLEGGANLSSDGRPILGLDARTFVQAVADLCPRCVVIPAHIWTPWFSVFGASSGFDALEPCFEEMTPFLFALETGLSSDPPMNWRLSALDKYALVSNSDAHSPSKIGREANAVEADFGYAGLVEAIRSKDPARFLYTVEFFPEEGKYHFDGHRACGVAFSPRESLAHGGLCPACGRKLTVGVAHRVEELADRADVPEAGRRVPFKSLIPLNEIIAQALGRTAACRSVGDAYFRFIREFGDEHRILTEVPIAALCAFGPEKVGRGIERMRRGLVRIEPGHDGKYGTVRLFDPAEDPSASSPPGR